MRVFRRACALAFLVALVPAGPARGQFDLPPGLSRGGRPAAPTSADALVAIRVTADTTGVRPGQRFHLAVVFDIEPHWHIYWIEPGDAGAPTEFTVRAPAGFTVGDPVYPRPRAFRDPDGTTYGYEREAVVLVPVTAPAALETGVEIVFDVDVFFLVCRERCLIGKTTRSVTLPVPTEASATGAASPDAALLARAKRRLPRPLREIAGATARLDGERLVVTMPRTTHERMTFFPIGSPGVELGEATFERDPTRERVTVPVVVKPHNAEGKPLVVRGLIALGTRPDDPSYEVFMPITLEEHNR